MKKKHLLISFLSIILILSFLFLSGCIDALNYLTDKSSPYDDDDDDSYDLSDYERDALDDALDDAEEQFEEEKRLEESKAEEAVEVAKEEIGESEEIRPDEEFKEIITLKGSIWEGSELILTINMKTKEVRGSVTHKDSNNTYDGKITEGKIDLGNLEITARCCGTWVEKNFEDSSGKICIDITGQLSKDHKEASGMAEIWSGPNEWSAFSVD